ncbi:Glycine-rich RNA-binding protein 3 [Hibiscus syriacus]|uniref:Glycine-rich RNA-binding protein 3 n=1 Tax=Hibiscus syriacus TaxID=106335 RepID=A0A6A3CQB2_HIBSY|nr:Glycine-rich RNA-binding protein 3 [Hibiscus syriacus]
MDSWFVAAAAAGYLAKFWLNLTTDRKGFSEASSAYSGIGKVVPGKDPVHKFAMIRKPWNDDSPDGREFSDRKISDTYRLSVASAAEMDSASGFHSEKMGGISISNEISLSATPILRPLLITDGSRVINRAAFEKNGCVYAIPPLPIFGSPDLPEKLKCKSCKSGNERDGRPNISCKIASEKQFHSHWGRYDRVVQFCLGISIGIICYCIGNRWEVEKLRGLLKQAANLVQELLEMKDSLTVKELVNENYESEEPYHQKIEESVESLSKIEAELERLGLNMDVPNHERRLPDLVEIDPDFVADFAEGELRSDMVTGQPLVQSMSNEDRSGTSTAHYANYVVSPRELSLRLHEVIQSRLEERVQELETALENSQRKVKLMESEQKNPNNKLKFSTALESPPLNEDLHCKNIGRSNFKGPGTTCECIVNMCGVAKT